MSDLFKREKYGRLPRSLTAGGKPQSSYEIGNIVYWSPGPDIAIFYAHDGESIPAEVDGHSPVSWPRSADSSAGCARW